MRKDPLNRCPALIAAFRERRHGRARLPRDPVEESASTLRPEEATPDNQRPRLQWFQPLVAIVVIGLIALAWVLGSSLSGTSDEVDAAERYAKVNRALIAHVSRVSKRADREIVQARIAAVPKTCEQFNDIQGALSRLIRVSLRSPRRPDVPPSVYRAFRRDFKAELEVLRPNDCDTQIKLLRKKLREQGYDATVPYQPEYHTP